MWDLLNLKKAKFEGFSVFHRIYYAVIDQIWNAISLQSLGLDMDV
jgi:hypothetical protein